MKIITIANSKRGVGKSTIALNLYTRLAASGAACAIVDADPQETIIKASKRRKKPLNLVKSIEDANGANFLLIDSPPYFKKSDSYIERSDLVVIPCNASPFDAETTIPFARMVGKKSVVLLNRVPVGSTLGDVIRALLEKAGCRVLKSSMHNRVAYARSGLVESIDETGDDKADNEINSITTEILILLSNG